LTETKKSEEKSTHVRVCQKREEKREIYFTLGENPLETYGEKLQTFFLYTDSYNCHMIF